MIIGEIQLANVMIGGTDGGVSDTNCETADAFSTEGGVEHDRSTPLHSSVVGPTHAEHQPQRNMNTSCVHPKYIIRARIARNVNGTDMKLFQETLIFRRKYMMERYGTSYSGPGCGLSSRLEKQDDCMKEEEESTGGCDRV